MCSACFMSERMDLGYSMLEINQPQVAVARSINGSFFWAQAWVPLAVQIL
jgi:hypothetical protein